MEVYVFGFGHYSEVIIELCHECGVIIKGLYHYNDDKTGQWALGYEIKGSYKDFFDHHKEGNVVVAVGDNRVRTEQLIALRNKGYNTVSLVHPQSYVAPSAKVGAGVYIHRNAFVWTASEVKDYSILSPYAMISHHAKIGMGCLVSSKSIVGSYVKIGDYSMVGINASIISKEIAIGEGVVIGASAMVNTDIPDNEVWIGVPAKRLKSSK